MIPGIWAEKPFGTGAVIPPEPDPDGPDDLLVPGIFYEESPSNAWLSGNDYKFGAALGMSASFTLPPDEEFVAGGVYIVEASCPSLEFDSTYAGSLLVVFNNEDEFGVVGVATENRYLRRSGYMRIPEDWNATQRIDFNVFFNDDSYDFILHSIFKIIEDPDEILKLNTFKQMNDIYFTKLIMSIIPSGGIFPKVDIYYPAADFEAGATYNVEFDASFDIIDTVSEITLNIGYVSGEDLILSETVSTAIINYLNASGGSGQFVVPSDWDRESNDLQIRLDVSGSAYPVRIKSIKLAV